MYGSVSPEELPEVSMFQSECEGRGGVPGPGGFVRHQVDGSWWVRYEVDVLRYQVDESW